MFANSLMLPISGIVHHLQREWILQQTLGSTQLQNNRWEEEQKIKSIYESLAEEPCTNVQIYSA